MTRTIKETIIDFLKDTSGAARSHIEPSGLHSLSEHHLQDVGLTPNDVAGLAARNLSQIARRRSGNW